MPYIVLSRVAFSVLLMLFSLSAQARLVPEDPLNSVMWQSMVERFMPDGDIVISDHVRVMAPESAEDQFNVPVTVDATALDEVEEIIAMADLNPIPLILRMRPDDAAAYIGFRVKLQQSSPVHVAVRTRDGRWHVSGVIVDAAGGGCTAPAMAHGTDNWMRTLGQTRALVAPDNDEHMRVTLRIRHPMDTGLAAGIPAFYLNDVSVLNASGASVAELVLYEPVSENPTLTFKPRIVEQGMLQVATRDTEGNVFDFRLDTSVAHSLLVQ